MARRIAKGCTGLDAWLALATVATMAGGGRHKRTGLAATLPAPGGRDQARARHVSGGYP